VGLTPCRIRSRVFCAADLGLASLRAAHRRRAHLGRPVRPRIATRRRPGARVEPPGASGAGAGPCTGGTPAGRSSRSLVGRAGSTTSSVGRPRRGCRARASGAPPKRAIVESAGRRPGMGPAGRACRAASGKHRRLGRRSSRRAASGHRRPVVGRSSARTAVGAAGRRLGSSSRSLARVGRPEDRRARRAGNSELGSPFSARARAADACLSVSACGSAPARGASAVAVEHPVRCAAVEHAVRRTRVDRRRPRGGRQGRRSARGARAFGAGLAGVERLRRRRHDGRPAAGGRRQG